MASTRILSSLVIEAISPLTTSVGGCDRTTTFLIMPTLAAASGERRAATGDPRVVSYGFFLPASTITDVYRIGAVIVLKVLETRIHLAREGLSSLSCPRILMKIS